MAELNETGPRFVTLWQQTHDRFHSNSNIWFKRSHGEVYSKGQDFTIKPIRCVVEDGKYYRLEPIDHIRPSPRVEEFEHLVGQKQKLALEKGLIEVRLAALEAKEDLLKEQVSQVSSEED